MKLELVANSITDVSALGQLTNLQRLNLYMNRIENISALASLTQMVVLNLANNRISDITPLASLSNLRSLIIFQSNPLNTESRVLIQQLTANFVIVQ